MTIKTRLKKTIKWNKYTSKPELLRQNVQLNQLNEPSFQVINRFLFYHLKMMHKK